VISRRYRAGRAPRLPAFTPRGRRARRPARRIPHPGHGATQPAALSPTPLRRRGGGIRERPHPPRDDCAGMGGLDARPPETGLRGYPENFKFIRRAKALRTWPEMPRRRVNAEYVQHRQLERRM
jgi:hypothetical protein